MLKKSKRYQLTDIDGNSLAIKWDAVLGHWVPAGGYLPEFAAIQGVRFANDILIDAIMRGDIEYAEL